MMLKFLTRTIVLLLLAAIIFAGPPAYSSADYDNGVRLYKSGKYSEAVAYFDREVSSNPSDSNALYYAADCYLRLGESARAVILYNAIIEKFPQSVAARYARRALFSVSRSLSNGHAPDSNLSSASPDNIPDSQVVPFSREQSGHLVVSCMINGRPQRMIFDTGASVCVATGSQMQSLGISIPADAPSGLATGVSGTVKTRLMPATIQMGDIKRQVTMSIMEELPTLPLLGESFFGAYQYIIDNASGCIRFMKPGTANVPDDTINIPFVRRGDELELTARINDVDVKLFFDTGAEMTVVPASVIAATNPSQWTLKGYGTSSGVGGTGTCRQYQVKSIEVGSIRNYDFKLVVVDNLPIAHGLLGQDFFAHRKFIIDNDRSVIRFFR